MSDAVELEHAVFVLSQGCMTAYAFGVLRALGLVERSRLLQLHEHACFLALLRLPASELFETLSCRQSTEKGERLRCEGEALLRDMSREDLGNMPDAGIRCAKCSSSEIAFDFLQTRSADEGTTVYCTCTDCGKRWKM